MRSPRAARFFLAIVSWCPSLLGAAPSAAVHERVAPLQTLQKVLDGVSAGRIIEVRRSDLDVNQTPETIVITCRAREGGRPVGGEVIVLQERRGSPRPVWRQKKLNPWKLEIADVDGDGKREIVVGVWKKSPKDPVMAKRVFVYSWNGKRMLPKWLGSRLSRRFEDFALADVNKDGWDELLALEVAAKGRRRVSIYRWRSFGFEWLGCSAETPGLRSLRVVDGKVFVTWGGRSLQVKYGQGTVKLADWEGMSNGRQQ